MIQNTEKALEPWFLRHAILGGWFSPIAAPSDG
jgi:hypothetical protein